MFLHLDAMHSLRRAQSVTVMLLSSEKSVSTAISPFIPSLFHPSSFTQGHRVMRPIPAVFLGEGGGGVTSRPTRENKKIQQFLLPQLIANTPAGNEYLI